MVLFNKLYSFFFLEIYMYIKLKIMKKTYVFISSNAIILRNFRIILNSGYKILK